MKYCCKKFEEKAACAPILAGGGFMYPPDIHPSAQFEPDEANGAWNINGCCGGGCFVATGMHFCPFCGAKLTYPAQNTLRREYDFR
jgi:hypothetical protein